MRKNNRKQYEWCDKEYDLTNNIDSLSRVLFRENLETETMHNISIAIINEQNYRKDARDKEVLLLSKT